MTALQKSHTYCQSNRAIKSEEPTAVADVGPRALAGLDW